MSPVAAVVLMCATMTGVKPFDIVKRLAVPLVLGLTITVILRMSKLI
jgi:DcuC family C4-dicarboxylate transporter